MIRIIATFPVRPDAVEQFVAAEEGAVVDAAILFGVADAVGVEVALGPLECGFVEFDERKPWTRAGSGAASGGGFVVRDGALIALIDQTQAHMPALGPRLEQPHSPTIAIMRRDDEIVGLQPPDQQVERRHARVLAGRHKHDGGLAVPRMVVDGRVRGAQHCLRAGGGRTR